MNTKAILSSWISIPDGSPNTLQNLPYGIFSTPQKSNPQPRPFTIIGDTAIDLSAISHLFNDIPSIPPSTFHSSTLNQFMSLPYTTRLAVRHRIISLLSSPSSPLKLSPTLQSLAFCSESLLIPHLPASIGDYTDFYSSKEHATNVGIMFRGKNNALQPNWLHLPVGYHGRSSTVVVDEDIPRPCGQIQKDPSNPTAGSTFSPSKLLDFELEMGVFVGGPPTKRGRRLTTRQAREMIFGFCLMNDWSARDVQKWEYVPLGPFTSKNFATSLSPWIVTPEALGGFRCESSVRVQDPVPLEYLRDEEYGSYDVNLVVKIRGEGMETAEVVCRSNYKNMYWSAVQQLVHHSVTGCNFKPGDLLGSVTISGGERGSEGSMLELSWKGTRDVILGDSGQTRKFLKDGDTVIMEGWCEKDGVKQVGFGVCQGTIKPAKINDEEVKTTNNIKDCDADLDDYDNIILYGWWRSSCTWRVRAALRAKGIPFSETHVDLTKQDDSSAFLGEKTGMMQVPVLECRDKKTNKTITVSQSLPIIEFLDECFSHRRPAFLPFDPLEKVRTREIAEIINSGVQPIQNLAVLQKIAAQSGGAFDWKDFGKGVIEKGLVAVERLIPTDDRGPFVTGSFEPTMADFCIIPQMFNARLFGVDLESVCPKLLQVEKVCMDCDFFKETHPTVQPDAC